jgi:hypothetical protein
MSVTRMKILSRRFRMLLILPAAAGVAVVVGACSASAAARRRRPHGSAHLARHRAPQPPGLRPSTPAKRQGHQLRLFNRMEKERPL